MNGPVQSIESSAFRFGCWATVLVERSNRLAICVLALSPQAFRDPHERHVGYRSNTELPSITERRLFVGIFARPARDGQDFSSHVRCRRSASSLSHLNRVCVNPGHPFIAHFQLGLDPVFARPRGRPVHRAAFLLVHDTPVLDDGETTRQRRPRLQAGLGRERERLSYHRRSRRVAGVSTKTGTVRDHVKANEHPAGPQRIEDRRLFQPARQDMGVHKPRRALVRIELHMEQFLVRLSARSPNLKAVAERFGQRVKASGLDRLVLIGEANLQRARARFIRHYDQKETSRDWSGQTPEQNPAGRQPKPPPTPASENI